MLSPSDLVEDLDAPRMVPVTDIGEGYERSRVYEDARALRLGPMPSP